MDPLTVSAAAGLRSRQETLDLIANNIANAATSGFKADRDIGTSYTSIVARQGQREDWRPAAAPVPDIRKHWTDFSQGVLQHTGNSEDLALASDGFFEVRTPAGPRWTRNGNFRVSGTGTLRSSEGFELRVRPPDGAEFRLNPFLGLQVSSDGVIHQNGRVAGTIEVMSIDKPQNLVKEGTSYFRFVEADASAAPSLAVSPELRQGYLEAPNVGPADSAVRLVSVMRQFESLQRALTLGAEMNRRATEETARIGS